MGITDENCCDSSSSESETDSNDVSDVDSVKCEHNDTRERFRQNPFPQQDTKHFSKSDLSTGEQCLDPRQLLVILQQCNWNWLEFVTQLKKRMQHPCGTLLKQMLENFAKAIPDLDISENDYRIIKQSQKVYNQQDLLREKQDEIDDGTIVSDEERDDPEELLLVGDPLDDVGKKLIKKKREAIHRKAKR